jgi:hypothetical protein
MARVLGVSSPGRRVAPKKGEAANMAVY